MQMHLLAVFVENKPGQTALITKALAAASVNIRWVTIASSGSFGVMKFLVNELEPAVAALKREGFMVSLLEIIAVEVPNKPGSLQRVADMLGSRGINLANCSGFVANNRAILIVEVQPQELAQARSILQQNDFELLSQQQMLDL